MRTSYAPAKLGKCKTVKETIGTLTEYYSYDTVVAFEYKGIKRVIQNQWGTTTGKHLSWIDGGSPTAQENRLAPAEFNKLLDEARDVSLMDTLNMIM